MNILLSRILKYLNGTLFLDDNYRFCVFFILNYQEFDKYTLQDVASKCNIDEHAILTFLKYLGYNSYENFMEFYLKHKVARLQQIEERYQNVDVHNYVNRIKVASDNDAFLEEIDHLCQEIHEAKRIILVGALYPMSLAVEMQTDLISFGKTVFQYHSYDKQMNFTEGDLVIFISATGRAMEGFMYQRDKLSLDHCKSLLITQNPSYQRKAITTSTIRVPGRFDGINFNYQIMTIFDLVRLKYYQTYIQE